jgi:hypothetical protein
VLLVPALSPTYGCVTRPAPPNDRVSAAGARLARGVLGDAKRRPPPCRRRDTQARRVDTLVRRRRGGHYQSMESTPALIMITRYSMYNTRATKPPMVGTQGRCGSRFSAGMSMSSFG